MTDETLKVFGIPTNADVLGTDGLNTTIWQADIGNEIYLWVVTQDGEKYSVDTFEFTSYKEFKTFVCRI